ncbi:hypothetical protein D3C76_1752450 [compost metagenome]
MKAGWVLISMASRGLGRVMGMLPGACAEHNDPVCQGDGFIQVVGDEQHGLAFTLP